MRSTAGRWFHHRIVARACCTLVSRRDFAPVCRVAGDEPRRRRRMRPRNPRSSPLRRQNCPLGPSQARASHPSTQNRRLSRDSSRRGPRIESSSELFDPDLSTGRQHRDAWSTRAIRVPTCWPAPVIEGSGDLGGRPARRHAQRRQCLADLLGQTRRIQPEHAAQVRHGAVVHEPVAGDPDDPDRHVAIGRVREPASSSNSSTPHPKPPVTTLSSNVTTSRLPRASSRISWRSSGLANRALMTPTDQPSRVERSAASIARTTIGPKPTNSRSPPSRSTSPCPIGSTAGSTRRQVEARVARVVQRERVVLGERRPEQRAQLLLVLRARRSRGSAAGAGRAA